MFVGVTTPLHIRALNRSGDSIPGAAISLTSLDPDTISVPAGTLSVTGNLEGSGRVVAQAGSLVSDPLRLRVFPP